MSEIKKRDSLETILSEIDECGLPEDVKKEATDVYNGSPISNISVVKCTNEFSSSSEVINIVIHNDPQSTERSRSAFGNRNIASDRGNILASNFTNISEDIKYHDALLTREEDKVKKDLVTSKNYNHNEDKVQKMLTDIGNTTLMYHIESYVLGAETRAILKNDLRFASAFFVAEPIRNFLSSIEKKSMSITMSSQTRAEQSLG